MQRLLGTNELNAMQVASLRDLCKVEGVVTLGTKSELVDRLCALPGSMQQPLPPLGASAGSKRTREESLGEQACNKAPRRSHTAAHIQPQHKLTSLSLFV